MQGGNMFDEHSSGSCPQRDPEDGDRRQNHGNILFVGNIPFQTPWQHVKDHFRSAGKVRYTDLIADKTGRPKGSALVTMATREDALQAIRMFDETDFEGRRLIVRLFDDGPRPQLVQREMMPPYVRQGQLQQPQHHQQQHHPPHQQQQQQQQQRMRGFGNANANMTSYNNSAGNFGRGGGYVNRGGYALPDDGNSGVFNDVNEVVPKPRSKQMNEVGRKLFVSNLPFDCTSVALRETFQQVGEVERAEIIMGRNGKSRGMGIVVMKTEEETRVAIEEFDGIEMANRAMNVRLDNKSTS